ncbi:RING finger protein 24 isoform X1 [Mirounga leonina]|uniref:RING finger protein 24 isoform X1 n=1 Tax=Mirounga leonina TaxID=9715 RepID=UPI00156C008F|nr:RING finger protein 24 isoform X1 [Mirounga leonina]XP_034861810.1 RING finger protein 24 isoform X1 [Mirounga leonina]XP_034861811.1 RING finger protein 24 isoform X1 [Mirounga leonina]XP_034861812.1 RING finger protein 24 isoform X1 [Mirounga leonina]XP_034861813.1 RING finger protein 24 isoform X1 [Mirounga leonina]XP_034861814.1 RING finger protein 24 isoform X1 [Mirounga leonina]
MSSDFPHYNFRMPNIGFQNLPLNIYIVVFGTAIFVFILSLLFCCYLIRLRHQAHKEFYAYKQVILKEKVKELNLHELCAVCLEDFKPRDELGICPCALLSGWRFGRCVHCATCQFCSSRSCTVSRTVDPHRGPCPGQRTLYSSPKDQTAAGSDVHVEPGGTQAVSVLAALPGAPAATSFAS